MYFTLFALALAWVVMFLFGGLELDTALLTMLHAGDRPDVARIARIVTELGGMRFQLPVIIAAAIWLAVRREFRSLAALIAITGGGRALVEFQKMQTDRVRPEDFEHLVEIQSLSFPSGHAANATMAWLTLALLLTKGPRARPLAVWAAVWIALAVGISRIVLGVHWPSDVIGGWAFAVFWIILCMRLAVARPDAETSPGS